jgi:lipoprotein-anchoring transpeptidase ErfK/SrfK
MRRIAVALASACAGLLTGLASPAMAYQIDPLTRQPLADFAPDGRAQATAIQRETVEFGSRYPAGTIVISTVERRMYYVLGDGKAIRYGVGVGRPGFEWSGSKTITRKAEWPDWRPPAQMLKRRPDLPRFMPGGPDNPLGARALYLGSSLYRIHGSNEPETIGQAVSSGCIRMLNDDVVDLYERVRVGTRVVVVR